jgi:glutathione peroxidase
MKIATIVVLAVLLAAGLSLFFMRGLIAAGSATPAYASDGSLYALATQSLDGKEAPLDAFAGQVVLVVNVASKCGLTPQYAGLQKLYTELEDEGFVILAFPSNQFMGQEPGSPDEIQAFCSTNYGVTFPLFAKTEVKGDGKSEIYQFLTAGGLEEPTWNFTKYLVGRDGKVIARYAPRTKPDDAELRAAIDTALAGGAQP